MSKQWVVYILECRDRTLYTGMTNDLTARVRQHEKGLASAYTRSRRPVCCVYVEGVNSRSAALKREASIKRMTRAEKKALVTNAKK